MDDDERRLFEDTLRRACGSASGAALDLALDELGWHEALAVDPRLAVASLFEQLGSANATASAVDAVVGSALGLKTGASTGVVLPALGGWGPPGRVTGEDLVVRGAGVASLTDTTAVWVVAENGDHVVAVEMATSALNLREVKGVDPGLGLVEVTGDAVPVAASHRLGPDPWSRAVALAQLALAHEMVGASRAMLELARAHALERVQFGKPIASFQAVRHRLADTLVGTEAAGAALNSAWDDGSPPSAAWAKALAGRSARTATRHCQQVLAGIGFTTEHDFHHYVRRVLALDQLFGTERALTRELGRELLATRQLPPLPPL
jgi:alkylation response protein AidB-like acyl-CoA dehydrogenase